MIALDTNAVVAIQTGRYPLVRSRLEEAIGHGIEIWISAVVLYELRYGIAKSDRADKNRAILELFLSRGFGIVDFTAEDADEAGDIRAFLEKAGLLIGHYDVLIAAQVRRRRSALITANIREFSRIPNLRVEDWSQ